MSFQVVTTFGCSAYRYHPSKECQRALRLPLQADFEEILEELQLGATDPRIAKVDGTDIEKLSMVPLEIEFEKLGALELYKLWYLENGMKTGFYPIILATCTKDMIGATPHHWIWRDLDITKKFRAAEANGTVVDLSEERSEKPLSSLIFSDDSESDSGDELKTWVTDEDSDGPWDKESDTGYEPGYEPKPSDEESDTEYSDTEYDMNPKTKYPNPNPNYPNNLWALQAPEVPEVPEAPIAVPIDVAVIAADQVIEVFQERRSSRRPTKRRRLTYTGFGAEHKELSEC